MVKVVQYILIMSIIGMGILYVAEQALKHQDTVCQEGC